MLAKRQYLSRYSTNYRRSLKEDEIELSFSNIRFSSAITRSLWYFHLSGTYKSGYPFSITL